jgi:deoxyribodipyrimidine photo-lyase
MTAKRVPVLSSIQQHSKPNLSRKYKQSLFIFRRDLRIQDNTALYQACMSSQSVICTFFVNPQQVSESNSYRGEKTVQFLYESLRDLDYQFKTMNATLHIIDGDWSTQLDVIFAQKPFDALFVNEDYTPFSIKRDEELKQWCLKHNCVFESFEDYTLAPIKDIRKPDGTPYGIFTPFAKKCQEQFFRPILPELQALVDSSSITCAFKHSTFTNQISVVSLFKRITVIDTLAITGGTSIAKHLLQSIPSLTNYGQTRNIPGVRGTTLLSPHIKFGTVSIRQVYWCIRNAFGPSHQLILELFWRDFFAYIGLHHPHVLGKEYQAKYRALPWSFNQEQWQAFTQARTGFPIVDAGITQLVKTGFMHNRVRMIVANFLIKDLHIDWRKGEQFFAQHLIDYDPLVNNGNWQWCAGTGCDAQPYYRIFNPWLQQQRFDPDCSYIRQWLPQLAQVPIEDIHSWNTVYKSYLNSPDPTQKSSANSIQSKLIRPDSYYAPIVDHSVESKITLQWYKQNVLQPPA